MKNTLSINNGIAMLLVCLDDGSNRLFINDTEIPSSSWVGSGTYTYTSGGVTFVINKVADTDGNIMLVQVDTYEYSLIKGDTGSISNLADATVDTIDTVTTEYPDVAAGDKVSTLFGKIKKFLNDLKSKKQDAATAITASNIGSQSVNYATTAGNANPNDNVLAYNANLNNITTVGFYSVGGGNAVTNKPSGVLHFGMIVTHNATGSYNSQIIPDTESGKVYIRYNKGGTWTSWKTLINSEGDTMTGRLTITGTASSLPLVTRGIGGSDGYGNLGQLYLNYGTDYEVIFGKTGQANFNKSGTLTTNGIVSNNTINISGDYAYKLNNRVQFYDLGGSNFGACANGGAYIRRYDNSNTAAQISASAFNTASSRLVKENVKSLDEDFAKKLLQLDIVSFDYIEKVGGEKNQTGMIAEDVLKILPEYVITPDDYNEEETRQKLENDEFTMTLSIDYAKFVPPLIKLVQMQQQQINELQEKIDKLKLGGN